MSSSKPNIHTYLQGFSKTLRHLDNHEFTIQSQRIVKPFQVERIQGEGMPVHNFPSQKGDLLVKYEVIFPTSLSATQQEKLREMNLVF